MPTTKHCTRCDKTKPVSAFQRNARRPDGLQDHCRECVTDAQRERRSAQKTQAALDRAAAPYMLAELRRMAGERTSAPSLDHWHVTAEQARDARERLDGLVRRAAHRLIREQLDAVADRHALATRELRSMANDLDAVDRELGAHS
jgi:LPS O-antigen subunit length determinant protein (WzzB/FepE family)